VRACVRSKTATLADSHGTWVRRRFSLERLPCNGARDGCRHLEETRRQSGDGTWDFGSRQEVASVQRGGFNGITQAFWGCVSPRPTTLRCNDPPPNIQDVPLQTTASQHETRRRHTLRETRLALPPGRFCHGDSATARAPELSLPMLPACVGLDATSSIEPVWWRSPSCSRLPLPPLAASPSLPVLADTPNQPSVAPTRHLAASARRSMTYSLKSSASLDCCARLYCRPTNGAPLFSHRDMRHFSPDLVCHVRRALFARYDHHGSTHRRPPIDRQVRPAWVPARSAKQVIASNFTVDAHGRCQSLMRFRLDADKPG